jgi:competence protein ComEC
LIGLLAIFVSLQVYGYYAVFQGQELAVIFLDVGQGDAAIVRFPQGKVMVIDGGGSPDGSFDPGERIVAPYLWKMKNKAIDFLVSTHHHPDHLQGLLFLLDNFKIGEVWHNGERAEDDSLAERFLSAAGERLQRMGQGRVPLKVNGVQVEFLHPPLGRQEASIFWGNDASLVLRLTFGEVSFLFCGDVEAAAEEEIRRANPNLQSTVIKVPHHGSKTSSTPEFVESVRPKYAVFTVKAGGRHRLPHPIVFKRYEDMGVKTFLSDRDGAVTFSTKGKDLKVQTFIGGR